MLPAGVKSIFGDTRRYSRVVAIYDSQLDYVVAWRCPDCAFEWARTELPVGPLRWEMTRYCYSTEKSPPWAQLDRDEQGNRWHWIAYHPRKGTEDGWCDSRESAMHRAEDWMFSK